MRVCVCLSAADFGRLIIAALIVTVFVADCRGRERLIALYIYVGIYIAEVDMAEVDLLEIVIREPHPFFKSKLKSEVKIDLRPKAHMWSDSGNSLRRDPVKTIDEMALTEWRGPSLKNQNGTISVTVTIFYGEAGLGHFVEGGSGGVRNAGCDKAIGGLGQGAEEVSKQRSHMSHSVVGGQRKACQLQLHVNCSHQQFQQQLRVPQQEIQSPKTNNSSRNYPEQTSESFQTQASFCFPSWIVMPKLPQQILQNKRACRRIFHFILGCLATWGRTMTTAAAAVVATIDD